jgi:hypothetical protein
MMLKTATTWLTDRAVDRQPAPTEGFRAWREAAQAQLPETVVDACIFSRPSNYTHTLIARQGGMVGQALLHAQQKMAAGGLPQHFILAVTERDVVVLQRTLNTRHQGLGKPGEEVARWSRATLAVTWKDSGDLYDATIIAPEIEGRIQCCVGKIPLSASFLELLADAGRMTPAA